MIQIESVAIRELRGIRELQLKPNRKCFVISGPNGSGKSGVVDAIQFALTGDIARLAGKGTGGLSVHRHGPHVDRRDDPEAAEVSLGLYVPSQNKSAVLTRNVKSAKTFILEPDDAAIRAIIEEVGEHPELSLSRREIIKYIIVEAGQRSKEIQALLKLEEIGETRGVLKTVGNKLSIALRNAVRDVENAKDALGRHLDLKPLRSEDVLPIVNRHRRTLGLSEFSDLKADTDFSVGVSVASGVTGLHKESALRDLAALERASVEFHTLAKKEVASLLSDVAALKSDAALLDAIAHRAFVQSGISLVSGPQCPLCDTQWEDEEHLRTHLKAKLAKANEAEAIEQRILKSGADVSAKARHIAALVDAVLQTAKTDGSLGFSEELARWTATLKAFARELDTIAQIISKGELLEGDWIAAPPDLQSRLATLKEAIQAKPDPASTAAAQIFLTLAQDRLVAYQRARREAKRSAAAVEAGKVVYKTFCEVADAYLSALYKAVEDEFSAYYRDINPHDEGAFKAKLEPEEGGLDLEVAFYDKGMFPPGAYHSEGHQDGMGVCLYLALMKRLLGDRFRFAVFDDVVMSVDQGHRKEFCRLLKTRFPDTQFIITTHDKVWTKQMQTEGVVDSKGVVAFQTWSLETGPIVETVVGIWDQIERDIARGEMDVASGRMRRHMEYAAGELADQLGATPTYRGDFSYDLGDLLPAVIGRHGTLLKMASQAANSWNDKQALEKVEAMKTARSDALAKYGGEAWVINKSIHYNEWAQFSKNELREVANAYKTVLELMRCSTCESWLYVTPKKGDPDALRCRCGSVILNLRAK